MLLWYLPRAGCPALQTAKPPLPPGCDDRERCGECRQSGHRRESGGGARPIERFANLVVEIAVIEGLDVRKNGLAQAALFLLFGGPGTSHVAGELAPHRIAVDPGEMAVGINRLTLD